MRSLPPQSQSQPQIPSPFEKALKKTRGALYETLRGKDAAIAELSGAVRRLQLAQRCGVGVEEVVTITVEVPELAVARVIGKGGANLKKIEEVGGMVFRMFGLNLDQVDHSIFPPDRHVELNSTYLPSHVRTHDYRHAR